MADIKTFYSPLQLFLLSASLRYSSSLCPLRQSPQMFRCMHYRWTKILYCLWDAILIEVSYKRCIRHAAIFPLNYTWNFSYQIQRPVRSCFPSWNFFSKAFLFGCWWLAGNHASEIDLDLKYGRRTYLLGLLWYLLSFLKFASNWQELSHLSISSIAQ